jgi:hypothetical protein
MAQTLHDVITKDKERLNSERAAIRGQQRELEKKLAEIDREYAAIDAYETAKSGKSSARKTGARSAPRARNGSRREAILAVVAENPDGLTRGELLEKMGLKGNKSGEMSVSNALTALAKGKKVARKGNKYVGA